MDGKRKIQIEYQGEQTGDSIPSLGYAIYLGIQPIKCTWDDFRKYFCYETDGDLSGGPLWQYKNSSSISCKSGHNDIEITWKGSKV